MRKQSIKLILLKGLGITAVFILMLSAFSGMASAEPGDVVWLSPQYYNDLETPAGDTLLFTCEAVATTEDNGCIVVASTEATTAYFYNRSYLVKLDANGDTLWVRYYGWDNYHYNGSAVVVDSDGGYVLAGDKQTPYYEIPPESYPTGAFIIKVDSNGDTLWTGVYNDTPGTYRYNVEDVYKTPDGGYALLGHTIRDGDTVASRIWDGFITKVDIDGREEWTRHYEGPSDESDSTWKWTNLIALSGALTDDGGYILSGGIQMIYRRGEGNRWITDNGMVMKVDANGDSVSTYLYGEHDQIFDVCAASDGGCLIGDLNRDLFGPDVGDFCDQATVVKIDDSWNESWYYDAVFDGGVDSGSDTSGVPRAVCEIPNNGGYVFAGQRSWFDEDPYNPEVFYNSQLFIAQFDNGGEFKASRLYEDEFGNSNEMPFVPLDLKVKENGNYIICGFFEQYNINGMLVYPRKGIVAEIEGTPTSVDDNIAELPEQVSLLQNYPNPFNATTKIQFALNTPDDVTLSVYDILGRKIIKLYDGSLSAGTHSLTWNGTDESGDVVSSGVYFYRLETSENTINEQMLLLK